MGFHLPSFLIGSSIAGCGFLLINRELSHRHRLTTKWALQEYAEKEWKEWRKSSLETITEATKVSNFIFSDVYNLQQCVFLCKNSNLSNILLSDDYCNACCSLCHIVAEKFDTNTRS